MTPRSFLASEGDSSHIATFKFASLSAAAFLGHSSPQWPAGFPSPTPGKPLGTHGSGRAKMVNLVAVAKFSAQWFENSHRFKMGLSVPVDGTTVCSVLDHVGFRALLVFFAFS